MSSGIEAGVDCSLVAGPGSACSSSHISTDSAPFMTDESVSALPHHMSALSMSAVVSAGASDHGGDNRLGTPQSSIISDAGQPVSAYQHTSQVFFTSTRNILPLSILTAVFPALYRPDALHVAQPAVLEH